jgi:Flp pilus assembly protein TadG
MRHSLRTNKRRGTIVPLLAVTMIGLLALVAMAVDIGLIALARNHCQNAADTAAMSAVRVLNGNDETNNNYAQAAPTATTVAVSNKVLGEPITESMVTTDVGYYQYNSSLQRFDPFFTGSKPATESWSAVRVSINTSQPMYFARVLGINSLPATALATAVHRPRDIALVLDYSGSMKYACEMAYPQSGDLTGSLNPDPAYPKFGHWSIMSSVMQRTTLYVDSGGETHAPNNYTMETQNGPPVVKDFLTQTGAGSFSNAFYQPTSPYNAMTFACPAPQDFDVQSDSTATYVGDKWPRFNKSFTSGSYAKTVQEWLFGNNTTQSNTHARSTATGPGGGAFDPADPAVPLNTEGYGTDFKGYSVGPGYYGKTFYVWPPDPRYHPTNSALQFDWRRKFFYLNGTSTPCDDNSALWDTSGYWKQAGVSGSYSINYNAVVAWLKSGPQVFPANLRAGRLLYYSSIPDTIPSSGGTDDQRFWRAYINYVIGAGSSTDQKRTMYGRHASAWGTVKITPKSSLNSNPAVRPYMHYNDNPIRPRLHFWFGPLSMLCFLAENNSSNYQRNWWPGTCHESQCWQLKVGIASALTDIKKNHPNDWVSMIFFSDLSGFTTARSPLGRDYNKMKNALFFPFSLLDTLSDQSVEMRPYNSSFSSVAAGNVPNADGGTSPETGFKVAYNQLSSRVGFNGRRGATKMVILETDGVPNTTSSGSFNNAGAYNSWYNPVSIGSFLGNNDPTVVSQALAAVQTICNLDTASSPGYSTAKNPVRAHSIAFGDLFQSTSPKKDQALDFLLQVQKIGKTSSSSATSIESYKIITGDYNTRVENLKQAFERIMQSGIQVTLIQ